MKKSSTLLVIALSLLLVCAAGAKDKDRYLENYSKIEGGGGKSFLYFNDITFDKAWITLLQTLGDSKYAVTTSSREDGMLLASYELSNTIKNITIFVSKDPPIKMEIKLSARKKSGFGFAKVQGDIVDLFASFEKNAGVTGQVSIETTEK